MELFEWLVVVALAAGLYLLFALLQVTDSMSTSLSSARRELSDVARSVDNLRESVSIEVEQILGQFTAREDWAVDSPDEIDVAAVEVAEIEAAVGHIRDEISALKATLEHESRALAGHVSKVGDTTASQLHDVLSELQAIDSHLSDIASSLDTGDDSLDA